MKLGKRIYDMNLRVVYYARVSTESDEQLNSLDNQQKFFEDYINNNTIVDNDDERDFDDIFN